MSAIRQVAFAYDNSVSPRAMLDRHCTVIEMKSAWQYSE